MKKNSNKSLARYLSVQAIYQKIISKIKVKEIDSSIAQKILNIAISENDTELLKTAADKGANLEIKTLRGIGYLIKVKDDDG